MQTVQWFTDIASIHDRCCKSLLGCAFETLRLVYHRQKDINLTMNDDVNWGTITSYYEARKISSELLKIHGRKVPVILGHGVKYKSLCFSCGNYCRSSLGCLWVQHATAPEVTSAAGSTYSSPTSRTPWELLHCRESNNILLRLDLSMIFSSWCPCFPNECVIPHFGGLFDRYELPSSTERSMPCIWLGDNPPPRRGLRRQQLKITIMWTCNTSHREANKRPTPPTM